MKISISVPAEVGSTRGNRITAERWGKLIRQIGYDVAVFDGPIPIDTHILIALHAGKSADTIRRFRDAHPNNPIVVAVTGTDVEPIISPMAYDALTKANTIVALQSDMPKRLPAEFLTKTQIIFQSVAPLRTRPKKSDEHFEIAVVGHLRAVKDPFLTAQAARLLPDESRVRVIHIGRALEPGFAEMAQAEMQTNSRYRWLGDLPHNEARTIAARCQLMVMSSKTEGGPAAIAESIVAGVPVLSTPTSGALGMLSESYMGYFPFGDAVALSHLISKAETDEDFYSDLQIHTDKLGFAFAESVELAAWKKTLLHLHL
jgi:putative glycosyltransferase (TIGR04348 family)